MSKKRKNSVYTDVITLISILLKHVFQYHSLHAQDNHRQFWSCSCCVRRWWISLSLPVSWADDIVQDRESAVAAHWADKDLAYSGTTCRELCLLISSFLLLIFVIEPAASFSVWRAYRYPCATRLSARIEYQAPAFDLFLLSCGHFTWSNLFTSIG